MSTRQIKEKKWLLVWLLVLAPLAVFGQARERKRPGAGGSGGPLITSSNCTSPVKTWKEIEGGKKHISAVINNMRSNADLCRQRIQELEKKNTPKDAMAIDEPAPMTLAELSALINKILSEQSAMYAKAKKEEKAKDVASDKAWEDSVKGDMKIVYKQHNNVRPYSKKEGSDIVWTFRSYTSGAVWHECEDYVFSSAGKKKSHKKYQCQ